MKLSSPKKLTWLIALILAIVSLLGYFVDIPVVSKYVYWIMAVAWFLLFLGTSIKGF